MFPKAKRFVETGSCAPPVGKYNLLSENEKKKGAAAFSKSKRFTEAKDIGPGPADMSCSSILDVSNCSIISNRSETQSVKLSTNSTKNKVLEDLKNQLAAAMSKLHRKEQELSDLRMDLKCEVESLNADLKAEKTLNISLSERLHTLENQNQDIIQDRDQAEEEIRKLQGIIDQLRSENDLVKEKLESREKELQVLEERMENCLLEQENKIKSLHNTIDQEIEKTKALKQQLEEYKDYKAKFAIAEENFERLKFLQSELEEKLVEALEREDKVKERASCLEARKIDAENRLESCVSEYEQKLCSATTQIQELKQELTCSEELLTENLKSLTAKYEDLEEFHANFTSKRNSDLERVSAELEATKTSLTNSKEEGKQYQCVVEDLRDEITGMEEKMQKLLSINESLSEKLQSEESAKNILEQTVQQILQDKDSEHSAVTTQFKENENTISCLQEREKLLARELERALCTQSRQDEELNLMKEELERVKCEAKESNAQLHLQVARLKTENQKTIVQLKEMEEQQGREATRAEERTLKIKEEFGRRLVETQKKLSQAEMNFCRFKEEQENKLREAIEDGERSREEYANQKQKELQEMYERKSVIDDTCVAQLKAEIDRWRSKCEEQEEKMAPFKEQLDNYEAERRALLSQNSQAQDEVAKLGLQYAKLLGHQNQKQKIHHVQKMKEENIGLKAEVRKLTEQCEKLKRGMKRVEEKCEGTSKKKFDPNKAFNHPSRKENTPLSVISNGNISAKR